MVYHVNNVKYIELIVNSFPKETHLKRNVKSLEVNYLGEAKYGEDVLVFSEEQQTNQFRVKIVRETDNKEVCRANLVFA